MSGVGLGVSGPGDVRDRWVGYRNTGIKLVLKGYVTQRNNVRVLQRNTYCARINYNYSIFPIGSYSDPLVYVF